jgi:hypothetical protein
MYRKWALFASAVAAVMMAVVLAATTLVGGPNAPQGGHGTPLPTDSPRPAYGTNPGGGGGFEWGEGTLHVGPVDAPAQADRTE